MKKEILCTLGPASLNDQVIPRLEELGVSLLRINLSHTKIEDLANTILYVKKRTSLPICLDSEGAQIRTGNLSGGKIVLKENSIASIPRYIVPGDLNNFNLYPSDIIDELMIGDLISIDFNSALAQVISKKAECVLIRVLSGGLVGQNKAVTVERDILMPPLTKKDYDAFAIGISMGIRHVALSFANKASDVDEIRSVVGKDTFVISKIECRNGLVNLDGIAAKSDALLLDRGDMSRQVPIERIPKLQKRIIHYAKKIGKKVYVATNLLESMITTPVPTRAEVNDIFTTLNDGAHGLVLAAETAIGSYPVGCVKMIRKIIHEFENNSTQDSLYDFSNPLTMLIAPHGGHLVHREVQPSDLTSIDKIKSLIVCDTDIMDCENIALGTYSPITGFMDSKTLNNVLNMNRLPNGVSWTMPIVLQVAKENIVGISEGDRIALRDYNGKVYALLDIDEIYSFDFEDVALKWFGTVDAKHPGVAKLVNKGNIFISGNVLLVERISSQYCPYEMTAAQSRFVFSQKGWNKIIGAYIVNFINQIDDHIQMNAIKLFNADGVYIGTIVECKKNSNSTPKPKLLAKSYQTVIDANKLHKRNFLLGSFSSYHRFCGHREAVFEALCFQNRGCSHFVVGQYYTFGDIYKDIGTKELFNELNDIEIVPIFTDQIG